MDQMQIVGFLAYFIVILGRIIVYAIIGRIIVSWLQTTNHAAGHGKVAQILRDVTEPFIKIARKIPHRAGMFDFAPLIAIIAVDLLTELSAKLLLGAF